MDIVTIVKGGSKWLKLGNLLWLQPLDSVSMCWIPPSISPSGIDLCDFTAFEIKCSWKTSLRLLGSALPDGNLLRCLFLCLQGGAWVTSRAHTYCSRDRFMHYPHKATKTLILEPRGIFCSKQLTWAPGSKLYIYISPGSNFSLAGPQLSLSHWDGRISKWLFINSCRPKLLALEWEGEDGSRSQGLAETFHANQDDWPQTFQTLNLNKLQKRFPSSRCWPCIWPNPLKEAWEGVPLIVYLILISHHKSSQLPSQGCFIH